MINPEQEWLEPSQHLDLLASLALNQHEVAMTTDQHVDVTELDTVPAELFEMFGL